MTMDEFKKKFAEIEKEMMEADHQNEFLQPPLWARLTDLMSEDRRKTKSIPLFVSLKMWLSGMTARNTLTASTGFATNIQGWI